MRRSRWVNLCFGLASVLSAAGTPEGWKVKAIAASYNGSVAAKSPSGNQILGSDNP